MGNKIVTGKIVDVVNRGFFRGEIEIENGLIKRISHRNDVDDVYIMPGLVDSHVHIESSMLLPSEFAKAAVKFGTVATVSDPHEIANVMGMEGVEMMIKNGNKVPVKFHFGAPSCVPATSFESSGFVLGVEEIDQLLQRDEIKYLSEMMNYPGVIFGDELVAKKLKLAKKYGKPVDGHAPGVEGEDLKKYVIAGITTDHECFTIEEAEEKIRLGMKVQIREGSAAKNFDALMPLIDKYPDEVMLCTDDNHPDDLVKGHIDKLIKRGFKKGLNIFNLLRATTYNPIKHYNLKVGLLQEGDPADFIVIDNFDDFNIQSTYIQGELVFDGDKVLFDSVAEKSHNNFNCQIISQKDVEVKGTSSDLVRVIETIEGELITKSIQANTVSVDGKLYADINADILKIIVVNRYSPQKPIVGFIKGFGFIKGAIASSIAHDSHNIIAVGTNDADLVDVINMIIESKGGIAVCDNSERDILPLNIGGIMSNIDANIVADKYEKLNELAFNMGSNLKAPFMTLSFMALLVIPSLKIGDKGLFDGDKFEFTDLIVR